MNANWLTSRILLSIALLVSACWQPASFAAPPTKEQIAQAIKNLGADDYKAREDAEKLLWQAGKGAEPSLLEATKSNDAEVVWRAQRILLDFKYGIYPETPAEIRQLLRLYRDGDAETKRNIVNQLFERGADGYEWLLRIANAETDEEAKNAVWARVRQKVSEALPELMTENKFAEAESLLEAAANSGDALSIRHYVAFLMMQNKLDVKIPALRARHRDAPNSTASLILTYLFRAKGDYENARKAAEESGDAKLLTALLREMSDWKKLAAMERERHPIEDEVEHLGVLAAYYRLLGNQKEFDETIGKLAQAAKELNDRDAAERAAQALLINGKWREGIAAYLDARLYAPAARVLRAQGRYTEAAEVASRVGEADSSEVFTMELETAGEWLKLGETKRARALLDKLSKIPQHGHNLDLGIRLLLHERHWGLHDLAYEHGARMIDEFRDEQSTTMLLGTMYYKSSEITDSALRHWGVRTYGISSEAELFWSVLTDTFPNDTPRQRLARVHAQMQLDKPNDEIRALLKDADAVAENATDENRRKWMWGLAEAHKRLGLTEQAVAYLDKYAEAAVAESGSTLLWGIVGDYLMEQKRWKDAAERYERALKKYSVNAIWIYKRGYCLAQAGDKKEGERLMALARFLPMADDTMRRYLAAAMEELGKTDEMRREYDFILRTSDFIAQALSHGAYYVTEQLPVLGENLKGAALYELHLIDCLTFKGGIMHGGLEGANLTDPHLCHLWRMRGLMDAKPLDAALVNARKSQEIVPADINAASRIVPALEAAKRRKEADEIFGVTHDALQKILAEFPNSHTHLGEMATLLARCRRQLEAAQLHATKAVELAPQQAVCHAALGEVQLARGERARAIESFQRAAKLDAKNKEYPARLKELGAR